VLELEIFQRAEAFVVAGHAGLDRSVRWVHVGEIPDIAAFLTGGELLLTAGRGVGGKAEEQRAYIASLADAGVAAVAIELAGRIFDRMPAAVVEEANRRGLPVIGLVREIPFVEVSAQVHGELTDNSLRQYERSAEVNRLLTERLLAGADYVSLVRDLAKNVGRPVVLESALHEVRAYYGETERSQQLLTDWQSHARSEEIHDLGRPNRNSCRRVPVVVQGTTWGWIHMPSGNRPSDLDQVAVEQGASAVAISLLNERVNGARSAHHEGMLIDRLMLGDITGAGFVDRSLRLGKDLRGCRLIVAIVGSEPSNGDLVGEITASLDRHRITAVTAQLGEAVVSVIALRGDRSLALVVDVLGAEQRTIGLSKTVDPDALASAINQARAAFSAHRPLQFFDQLGLLRLLVPLVDSPELPAYVEDELGPLIAYDTAHDRTLLPTLEALLDCDGNKTDTARRLFVQRRTLYYRLERIEQILGQSLESVEARLRLNLAVRAWRLLQDRTPAANRRF
jgi:purine catabolism regulator